MHRAPRTQNPPANRVHINRSGKHHQIFALINCNLVRSKTTFSYSESLLCLSLNSLFCFSIWKLFSHPHISDVLPQTNVLFIFRFAQYILKRIKLIFFQVALAPHSFSLLHRHAQHFIVICLQFHLCCFPNTCGGLKKSTISKRNEARKTTLNERLKSEWHHPALNLFMFQTRLDEEQLCKQ